MSKLPPIPLDKKEAPGVNEQIAMGKSKKERPIDRPLTPKEVEELHKRGTTSGGSPGRDYKPTK